MQNSKILLLFGEEDFLIDEKINSLKKYIPNPALNVETLDGRELSVADLTSALCTQPLLGGEKLVIVRDFKVEADEQEQLIAAIKNIPADSQVVFQAGNIDKRSRFYKLVNQRGEVIEFRTFAPWEQNELLNWIADRTKSEGKKIAENAARRLYEICGNNLRLLVKEIEKIVTYIGDRKAIEEEDVLALASAGEMSAFALLDALREKKLAAALSILQILLKNKEDLFGLLGLLTTQYRLMLQIKSMGDRISDPNQIARTIGGRPYFIKKCSQGISCFSIAELKKAMESLLDVGMKLKTGEEAAVLFPLLLAALCGR